MRTLDRKLLRELFRIKGQVIAIGLIVACGIASWVTVLTAYRGLNGTRDAYYREYRMADLFAPVKKAPRSALDAVERIPGVRRVRARITFEVSIDLPELPEPCFGRVLSVPDARKKFINDLHIMKGRWFSGDGNLEVIVGDRFAKEHDLEVGDRLRVIMNNRKKSLTIVATALSPEYIYMIRGTGNLFPDPVHFTVLWFSESFAESVFAFRDSANEFVATLDREANVEEVIDAFDRELDRYGAYGAFAKKDQISHRVVNDEIEGLKGTATMVPTIFLGVAAFVLHMLLGRLVRTQRTQIAVFRAFGYSTGALSAHYLKLAILIGSLGALVGTGLGLWFGKGTLQAYQAFYQFPVLRFSFEPVVVLGGVFASLFFAALGALSAVRAAARVQPAEGLRPEAPGIFKRSVLERWRALWSRLGFLWRMVIRNVSRTKRRSLLTVGGSSLSASIIFLALFSTDSMDGLMDHTNHHVDLQDATVTFNRERSMAALYEIRRLPGVRLAEPQLVVPVRLVNGYRERQTGIFGLPRGGRLRGLVDTDLNPVELPEEGLLLTKKLALLLDVHPGDHLEVHVLEGDRKVLSLPVTGTVDEYMGVYAYTDLSRLCRWIGEEQSLNSVRLLVDEAQSEELSRALKDLPAVETVSFKKMEMQMFEETLVSSMAIMTGVLTVFAGVIAFGVIYNSSRIALAERERTLASMRVLGFRKSEVSAVLFRENYFLTFVSIPFGLGLGVLFAVTLAKFTSTDLFRLPVIISGKSLFLTALAVVVFTVIANLFIGRRLRRLDLVEALKSRE